MIVVKVGGGVLRGQVPIFRLPEALQGFEDNIVIVVSAFGKTTDCLESVAERALEGDRENALHKLAELLDWHFELASKLDIDDPWRESIQDVATPVHESIKNEPSFGDASMFFDRIVSLGEQLSSRIIAGFLTHRGFPVKWVDAAEIMITNDRYGAAEPIKNQLRFRAGKLMAPVVSSGIIPIIGGFIGATMDGFPTTLGREGSDYTAALLACALGAQELVLLKDVDGVYSSDPSSVPSAKLIPELTFSQAARLFRAGAEVVHPKTITPVEERGIRIRVTRFGRRMGGTQMGPSLSWAKGRIHAVVSGRVGGCGGGAGGGLSDQEAERVGEQITVIGEPPISQAIAREVPRRLMEAGLEITVDDPQIGTWVGLTTEKTTDDVVQSLHDLVLES